MPIDEDFTPLPRRIPSWWFQPRPFFPPPGLEPGGDGVITYPGYDRPSVEQGTGTRTNPDTQPGTSPGRTDPYAPPTGTDTRDPSTKPQEPELVKKERWYPTRPARYSLERKMTAQVQGYFAILDMISESSELVEAFYQALPANVRGYYDKQNAGFRMGDTLGQFGISGADWKMRALYNNWYKVDLRKAIANVIANQVEDAIIGRIQAKLSKVYPRSMPNNPVGQMVSRGVDYSKKQAELWAAR